MLAFFVVAATSVGEPRLEPVLRVNQNMVQEEPDAEQQPLPAAAIAAAPGTLIDDSVLADPGEAALLQAAAFAAAAAVAGAAVESPIFDHPAGLGQAAASQAAAAAVGPAGGVAASSASPAGIAAAGLLHHRVSIGPNRSSRFGVGYMSRGTGDPSAYQTYMWEAVDASDDQHFMVDHFQDWGIL